MPPHAAGGCVIVKQVLAVEHVDHWVGLMSVRVARWEVDAHIPGLPGPLEGQDFEVAGEQRFGHSCTLVGLSLQHLPRYCRRT